MVLLLVRSIVNSKYCHMCNSVYTPLFQIKNCLRILCLRFCYFKLFLFIGTVGINISINIKSLTTWFRIRRSSKLFSPFYVLHHQIRKTIHSIITMTFHFCPGLKRMALITDDCMVDRKLRKS